MDWDDDDFEVELPATKAAEPVKDAAAFDGEDEEDDEKPATASTETSKPKSDKTKKKNRFKEEYVDVDDETLDDPLAEKMRLQRLEEEADLKAAQEMFGGAGKNLESFIPKTEAEFVEYGELMYAKYLRSLERNPSYRALLKALLKKACTNLESQGVKEIESHMVTIRNEKLKEDKAKQAKKKGGVKKTVNLANDDLEDYKFGNVPITDEDYDFM